MVIKMKNDRNVSRTNPVWIAKQ